MLARLARRGHNRKKQGDQMPRRISRSHLLGLGCAVLVLAGNSARARDESAPPTPQHPVTDQYHGVTVTDPYRWLENAQDPAVHQWSLTQDARTRKYLDALPQRERMYQRLMQQISATSPSYEHLHVAGERVFALYTQPPKQQKMIALLTNAADPKLARVVVDPNVINPAGTTAIDWFVPSPDGKWLAVSMSDNGSEDGTLHLFEVATGKDQNLRIPRVQYPTGGGSLAWREDGQGFWYTRYPGRERPSAEQHFYQHVYFHRLGDDPARDALVIGEGLPKVAEIELDNRYDPKVIVASVANGDGGEFEHFLIDGAGHVRQVTHFADRIVAATPAPDGSLYLVSRKGAPRGSLLVLPAGDTELAHAKVAVAESDGVMQSAGELSETPIVATADLLYLPEIVGGPSRVSLYDHAGAARGVLPLPPVASVDEVRPLSDGSVLYRVQTYLQPPAFMRYEPTSRQGSATELKQTSPVSFSDAEVVRETARSKDGTAVPFNIVRRKGAKPDAAHPAPLLLNGYGGYGISETPTFLGPRARLWLDGGGIYVTTNLRGGAEFGETWHQQGALTHKQHVFDDFIAVAEWLIAHHYTDREHLAIIGGSNGGLLMGAVMTQRPDLFRAVVSRVGIYDMLRVERDPNGTFNTTEFGSTQDDAQFKALYAYSPYHHVKDGAAYPAVLMLTGETDGRVNPAHSRKMIARLQEATGSKYPVLLTINAHAGHGIGSALSIVVNQYADIYAFLFDQLGMKLPAE
jgi:prolyl oligopeptidase